MTLLWSVIDLSAESYSTQALNPSIRSLRVRSLLEAQWQSGGGTYTPTRNYLTLDGSGLIDGSDPANTLEISFDELSHDPKMYSYTVRHLNRQWQQSDISSYEYLHGFTTADIDQYTLSLNTRQDYSHYAFTFPNESMQLSASGNYVILIYEDGDIQRLVAQVCFSVVEPLADVALSVRSNTDIEFDGRYQQLDITVNTKALNVRETADITLVVEQNNRPDTRITLRRPTFIQGDKMLYQNNRELIFEGGNEYRHFDSYSTYYAGYHIDRIRYGQGDYHAFLDADELRGTLARGAGREGSPYLTEPDNNGVWIVNAEKTNDIDSESEYMWVHWTLPVRQAIDGQVFVLGDLFQNRCSALSMMQYDAEQMCYHLEAYLKQGGYEYLIAVQDLTGHISLLPIEGSHWQTGNEYTVWVYYHPFDCRYDRIVGIRR